jgi:hypothetical protein
MSIIPEISGIEMRRAIYGNAVAYTFYVPMQLAFTREPEDEDKEVLDTEPESLVEWVYYLYILAYLSETGHPGITYH